MQRSKVQHKDVKSEVGGVRMTSLASIRTGNLS
jgi:hypothetical protein